MLARIRTPVRLLLVAISCELALSATAVAEDGKQGHVTGAAVTYKIVQAGRDDPVWKVSIIGTGFKGVPNAVRLRMESWGGWLDVDDYYLRGLTSQPPIKRDPGRRGAFVLE